eukprot:11850642-Alexandrium_andersonii.AAC.1
MQIGAPEAPREARRLAPPLESGAPNFFRLRAAERAIWPVRRLGTATFRAGFWGGRANLTSGLSDYVGAGANELWGPPPPSVRE